jgi:tetrahydromethanopterin S-methyltransferase subunit D
MSGLGTTDYIEGAAAVALIYWGLRKESGWKKWGLVAVGAYFAYSVYSDYSAGGTTA